MAALGRKNSGLSMHHNHDNKDVAAPIPGFQIVIFPRFVGDSDALCFALFANPAPAGPCQVRSTDSIADNSGQFHRKSADFSRNVANVHALATRRRDAFFGLQLKPRAPSWSGAGDHRQAPLAHRFCGAPNQLARASFVQKQSPACAAGLFIGAETTRYFTEATFPNWLSNGL